MEPIKTRVKKSDLEWDEFFKNFESLNGVTKDTYCLQQGVSTSCFYRQYRKYKFRKQNVGKLNNELEVEGKFVEVSKKNSCRKYVVKVFGYELITIESINV
jgi:hypothetical protein